MRRFLKALTKPALQAAIARIGVLRSGSCCRLFVGLAILALAAPVAHANDDQIAEQIVNKLKIYKAQGDLKSFNLGLRVDQGSVYLSGYVASPDQERLALEVARRVGGVKQVFNGIKVRKPKPRLASYESEPSETETPTPADQSQSLLQPSNEESLELESAPEPEVQRAILEKEEELSPSPAQHGSLADAKQIASKIIERFREEKAKGNLYGFGIDVEVDQGVVWLKGRVSSTAQQQLALDIARRVAGVRKVVNDLNVTSAPAQATRQPAASQADPDGIAEEVVSRLQARKREGQLQDFGINVNVDDGIVWMSGYVADEAQLQLALDMARFVPGVKQVVNDLSIKPAGQARLEGSAAEGAICASQSIRTTAASEPLAHAAPGHIANGYTMVPVQLLPVHASHVGRNQTPLAFAPARAVSHHGVVNAASPMPIQMGAPGVGIAPARFDHPQLPGYAWPSYAAHPNYGAVTYPQQYSASAWPYIGPFYPYPQVPLGWRKVTLEWDDGWWQLDFKNRHH